MKTLMTLAIIIAIFPSVFSQTYIQGGLNLSNITSTTSGQTEKNNILTTFNAGILGRFDLSKTIDLESGLLVDGRGSKAESYFTNATDDNYVKSTFNPIYLEIPLNLVLRIPLEKNTNLFFHGGPYAAIGIAGNSKSESRILGVTSASKGPIKFSNDDPFTSKQDDASYDKLKRFDFGLNAGGGIDLGKVLVRVNYALGLTKINSTESNNYVDDKNKYRTIRISMGFPISR
ncbi:MAG: porin family protein [Ginsengibacter sp.]